MKDKKVLIVGGVACGGKAAARLMRVDPRADVTCWKRENTPLRRVRSNYYVEVWSRSTVT